MPSDLFWREIISITFVNMTTSIFQALFIVALFVYSTASSSSLNYINNTCKNPYLLQNHEEYISDSVVPYIIQLINSNENGKNNLSKQKLEDLKLFYSKNSYNPVWISDSIVKQGIKLIKNAKYHGLSPDEYGLVRIRSLFADYRKNQTNYKIAAQLDIELTNGILLFSHHLLNGKLNPKTYHSGWNYPKRSAKGMDMIILNIIKSKNVIEIESYFEPKNKGYRYFKQKMEDYFQLPELNNIEPISYPGFLIQEGDSNMFVAQLKHRLLITDSIPMVYTQELNDSIKSFQKQHGLTSDGIPGKKTYEFLSWGTQRYIDALRVNLERYRWLPDSLLSDGIIVNIPSFQTWLFKNDSLLFKSNVVVGKQKNRTPVFQSQIDYLVFNPCWTVPNSIALDKMLPRIKKDSNYLQNRNMFVGLNGIEQNTDSIDFTKYSKNNFPYKIYQRTGDGNALGKVKFMFSNKYSIYLHDTPYKNLFSKTNRAYSHGCVRVQNAMYLAEIILYFVDNHEKQINYYLKKGYPEKVYLKNTIPISLLYFTCFFNEDTNSVKYFKDIYTQDLKLLMDLEKY